MPMPAMSPAASFACASAARLVSSTADQISSGSCSTQPGRGKLCANSFCACAHGAPAASNTIARVLVVPWSMARMWEGRVMKRQRFPVSRVTALLDKGCGSIDPASMEPASMESGQWRRSGGRRHARPRSPSVPLRWHLIEKPGDRLEPVVGGDDAEIGSPGDCRLAFRRELPGEAHAVVMSIDIAGATELVVGEALLDRLDHRVDIGLALTADMRVEIARGLRPGPRDESAAALPVGLVPDGDIAIDQIGEIAHGKLHPLRRPRLRSNDRGRRRIG